MTKKNLEIIRYFVPAGKSAEKLFKWKKVDSAIRGREGGTVFEMKSVEAPQEWSQLAIDIAASKYFRKTAMGKNKPEKSVRQLVNRVVDAIVSNGLKQKKYFGSKAQAQIFAQELKYILWSQRAAFNSPVWFNAGLFEAYGLV